MLKVNELDGSMVTLTLLELDEMFRQSNKLITSIKSIIFFPPLIKNIIFSESNLYKFSLKLKKWYQKHH